MRRPFTNLTLDERRVIARMLQAKVPKTKIAQMLGRDRSTITREVKRNWWHDKDVPQADGYWHVTAQAQADRRRSRRRKLERLPGLRAEVIRCLQEGWSPEQIAGRLRIEPGAPHRLCHETIYQYVYSAEGQSAQLARLLAEARANALRSEGKTAMFVAVDGRLAGIVAVADPIKASTAEAIRTLHQLGLRVIMATGDNQRTAEAVAARLGIDEVRAGVLPEDKKNLIDALRKDGAVVAMAGDGVNDAPALAAADVGIAMGTGADVAVESAGLTLLGGDLMGVVRARRLAKATLRNIKQNLFFAFVYNAAGVPIAAGLLYPLTGMLLSPMIAAAAMSLSSVSVIANALRLRRVAL